MKWPRRKFPTRDWKTPDSGASAAREKAERNLEQTRRETEQVRSETDDYAQLGEDLREIYAVKNHLAQAFLHAAGGKRK